HDCGAVDHDRVALRRRNIRSRRMRGPGRCLRRRRYRGRRSASAVHRAAAGDRDPGEEGEMSERTQTPADVRGRIIRASILPIEDEETMIASLRSGAEAVGRGELDVDDFVGIWSQYLRQLLRASSVHA